MKQDSSEDSWFTTMIDLYGAPSDFPGLVESARISIPLKKAQFLQEQLALDIRRQLPAHPVAQRFIPYLQLHEFEALLFSDPSKFAIAFPDQDYAIGQLQRIRASFESPEHINNCPETAPSKRIIAALPDYVKTVSSLMILREVGLPTLRRECVHFDNWINAILARTTQGQGSAPI